MRLESLVDVTVERFETNPLVAPDSDDRIGTNVNGPSVVRAPAALLAHSVRCGAYVVSPDERPAPFSPTRVG